jgi:hypothetical protein
MARNGHSPINLGTLFDWHAGRVKQAVLHLDPPFGIAPGGDPGPSASDAFGGDAA